MKVRKWSLMSGLFSKLHLRDMRRLNACGLLSGSRGRGLLNGNGPTQLLFESFRSPSSIIFMNVSSWMEEATWLSSLVRLNTVHLRWSASQTGWSAGYAGGSPGGPGAAEPLLHMEHVGARFKESGPLQLCCVCVERANCQWSVNIT